MLAPHLTLAKPLQKDTKGHTACSRMYIYTLCLGKYFTVNSPLHDYTAWYWKNCRHLSIFDSHVILTIFCTEK